MLKKSLLAVFGLAIALAFATPEKAQAEVAIGVGVSIGGPIYARPVYSYPYAYGYYAPRPVYVYPRPYVYPHRVFYGRVYARPYLRHERFENRERYEHRDRFYRDRR